MLKNPPYKVLTARKQSGRNVTQAYLARPMLMMTVVPTASADRGEQLVRDAEQRPQRIDAARPDEVTPGQHHHRRGRDRARHPVRIAPRLPHAPAGFLQQEPAHARPRIDRRENEDRFEHDGEVVPVVHQASHAGNVREDLRHAEGERDGASRPADDVLADLRLKVDEIDHWHVQGREDRRRRVDGKVVARMKRGGGDQRHHADEAFEQHRGVPDGRMSLSLSTIFDVVPDAIRAWNPEMAPHAIVMNTNGNIGPG